MPIILNGLYVFKKGLSNTNFIYITNTIDPIQPTLNNFQIVDDNVGKVNLTYYNYNNTTVFSVYDPTVTTEKVQIMIGHKNNNMT